MKIVGPIILLNLGSSAAFTPSLQSKLSTLTPLQGSAKNDEATTRREIITTLVTTSIAFSTAAFPSSSEAREAPVEYLSEPTEAFKESERQRDEFRRKQLVIKKNFNDKFAHLTFDANTEDEINSDLEDIKKLITTTGGLPIGIKKDDMVKIIRAKKAKGNWPTRVEYTYQALIRELAYQQSPNKDKDTENPL